MSLAKSLYKAVKKHPDDLKIARDTAFTSLYEVGCEFHGIDFTYHRFNGITVKGVGDLHGWYAFLLQRLIKGKIIERALTVKLEKVERERKRKAELMEKLESLL